ncbi:MAG TPA: hemerythrin domain-containing protein [Anaerolineae bacterium]|jgi:hypothetical protein|nr:hemerythrin domain-containing protein [Anaerolineae bacterium]
MSDLINELRDEHAFLINSFSDIEHSDIESGEAAQRLQSLKLALVWHMRREHDELYSRLWETTGNNLQLQRTIELFIRDKEKLLLAIAQFLDKYSEGGSTVDFKRDFNRLSIILGAHIKREEEIIFSECRNIPFVSVA